MREEMKIITIITNLLFWLKKFVMINIGTLLIALKLN